MSTTIGSIGLKTTVEHVDGAGYAYQREIETSLVDYACWLPEEDGHGDAAASIVLTDEAAEAYAADIAELHDLAVACWQAYGETLDARIQRLYPDAFDACSDWEDVVTIYRSVSASWGVMIGIYWDNQTEDQS